MFTAAMFDQRSVRSYGLNLAGGEFIRRNAYPFPDGKLLVIARSDSDGRTGKPVIHNRSLKERTQGRTQHMEVENGFRLLTMLEHMLENGQEEEKTLSMRVDELKMCARFLRRRGRMKPDDDKEIFNILRDIERSLGEPKRDSRKLAASRDARTAVEYRSPKAGNPVGPVSAMAADGAVKQLEKRIANVAGIRRFVSVRHVLVHEYLRYATWQFRLLRRFRSLDDVVVEQPAKDGKPEKTVNIHQVMRRLDYLRMQPFATPAHRILSAFEGHRHTDTVSEDQLMRVIREETHLVLLVVALERKLLKTLSECLHKKLEGEALNVRMSELLAGLTKIDSRMRECQQFSDSVRNHAHAKLTLCRNLLSQESFDSTPRKRLMSAERILKELAVVLPH